jgi:hypothetical protein
MEQNLSGGMKHQEEQEKREQKNSKACYFKIEPKNYYIVQTLS